MIESKTQVPRSQKFVKQWTDEFLKQANAFRNRSTWKNAWHGVIAYRELHRKEELWRVDPNWIHPFPALDLLRHLAAEVDAYMRLSEQVSAERTKVNEAFAMALDHLSMAEKKLRKARLGNAVIAPYLSSQLNRCADKLAEKAEALDRERKEYWPQEWADSPEQRRKWPVYIDGDRDRVAKPIPPEEITRWQEKFAQAGNFSELNKRIDLDLQFQLRIAIILRSFIPLSTGISLQTIARLVVLTYICGELAREDHKGNLKVVGVLASQQRKRKTKQRERKLTTGAVVQKLQNARIK